MRVALTIALLLHLLPTAAWLQVLALEPGRSVEAHLPEPQASPAFTRTAFQLIDGMLLIQARVNGETGQFILDTGAPTLILNSPPGGDAPESFLSITGDCPTRPATVASFAWAGIERRDMPAQRVDLSHLEEAYGLELAGIVGFRIFADRELLINAREQLIFVSRPHEAPFSRLGVPVARTHFVLQEHLPVIQVRIGGRSYAFGMDSGCSTSLIDPSVLAAQDGLVYQEVGNQRLQGMAAAPREAMLIELDSVRVADLPGTRMAFLLSDLSPFQSSDLHISGLLGYSFLRDKLFSINFARREIAFYAHRSPRSARLPRQPARP